ncbi:MAG: hypothetical protein JSV91_12620 [Phycisphaerales bacterium]|nr:MAG: hypothetical protein JSV91_12620 [Phycisphaerales bacterium]
MTLSATSIFAASVLLIPAAPQAQAEDFYWNNENYYCGVFGDSFNWNYPWDDEIPGETDVAIFDVPGIFTVDFLEHRHTDRAIIRSGLVAFHFNDNADYWPLNANPDTPAVVVGLEGGDVAGLKLSTGKLQAAYIDIGYAADSLGLMEITGDGDCLDYEKRLRIGAGGIGFLHIHDLEGLFAPAWYYAYLEIASESGSFGRVTVGPDITWHIANTGSLFTIAKGGTGELTVTGDSTIDCHPVIIAHEPGSVGIASIDDSEWLIDGTLDVGRHGLGSLDIRNGGTVTAGLTTLGVYRIEPHTFVYGEGGVGAVTVTGGGSSFSATDLIIGYEAIGKLTTAEDGVAVVTNNVTIAYLPGFEAPDSVGTLVCSEGGTIEIGGNLIRGGGNALISIELGATDDYYDYPAISVIGSTDDFDAEVVLVDDFVPQMGDAFRVAHADGGVGEFSFELPDLPPPLGWLVIQDGYDVMLQVVDNPGFGGTNGRDDRGEAQLPVSSGSRPHRLSFNGDYFWNNARDRGQFDDPAFWNDGASGVPGDDDLAVFDAAGIFDVDFLTEAVTDRLLVRRGIPTFHLSAESGYTLLNPLPSAPGIVVGDGEGDAAKLIVEGGPLNGVFTNLAFAPDAVGFLALQGPDASLTNDQHLHVGHGGAGILTVDGGSIVANGHGMIASAEGAYGQATVTGLGTLWTCDGSLAVGKNGYGELIISDGAGVTCLDAIIAQYLGSMGSVTVSGAGSSWYIDGTLDVGMTGFGSMLIEDGGSVFNHTFATISTYPYEPWYVAGAGGFGDVTVTGEGSDWTIDGDLYVGYISYLADLVISDDATVNVTGSLFLDYDSGDSTLAPGRNGSIHIGGDCEIGTRGYLVIELGESDYQTPAIDVTGSMNEAPAEVQLAEGFIPQWGDVFHIVHTGAGVGEILFTTPDLPPPLGWEVINDGFDVKLKIVSTVYGDLNGDGKVNLDDLFLVLAAWGTCDGCPEDLNNDGKVNLDDVFVILNNWT